MASLDDYREQLERHPLVLRAASSEVWGGAWHWLRITVSLWNDWPLSARPDHVAADGKVEHKLPPALREEVDAFHARLKLRPPHWKGSAPGQLPATIRELLYDYLARYRMTGHEVFLHDVQHAGVDLGVRVYLRPEYFQSEVKRDVERVLGRGPDGFFRPGRLAFGQTLQLSDLYEVLMPLDGVQNVELLEFRRHDHQDLPARVRRSVEFAQGELAVCHSLPGKPELGGLRVVVEGGRRG